MFRAAARAKNRLTPRPFTRAAHHISPERTPTVRVLNPVESGPRRFDESR